jgi:hypothetical protein
MDYKNKYLKYKNKYLSLKKQIGGMMDGEEDIPTSNAFAIEDIQKKILILCHNRKIIDIEKEHHCFIVNKDSKIQHSSLMEHIPPNSQLITMDIETYNTIDRVDTPNIIADLWDKDFTTKYKEQFDGIFMVDCHTWKDDDKNSIAVPLKAIFHTCKLIKKGGFGIYSALPDVIDKVCNSINKINGKIRVGSGEDEYTLKCEIIDEKADTACYPKYLKITSL